MKFEVTYTYFDLDVDTFETVTVIMTEDELADLKMCYIDPDLGEKILKVTAL